MDNNALHQLTHGLYVLGTKDEKWFAGCIIDALMQTTSTPPTLAICCMNRNRTGECISQTKEFSVSVLHQEVKPIMIANFGFQSGRTVDKWEGVEYELINGLPALKDCAARMYCTVIDQRDLGTHTMFYCNIAQANMGKGEPMTYKYYQDVVKTKTAEAFAAKRAAK